MSTMYIRVRKDGFLYPYNEIMAKNPSCEVITEEEAYPERFVPKHAAARVEASGKGKAKPKAALDLSTADIPEAPVHTPPELASEAARGLP